MASHLSCIGVNVSSKLEFNGVAKIVARHGVPHPVSGGSYVRWGSGDGPELWVQLGPTGDINGMNPHYAGDARIRLRLLESVRRESQTDLDGAWLATEDPPSRGAAGQARPADEPSTGLSPRPLRADATSQAFCFDCPDFFLSQPGAEVGQRGTTESAEHEVQLAAFPERIAIYTDVATYESASPRGTPVETFCADCPADKASLVRLSGRILEADQRINPLYNQLFHRALVQTVGGTVDVVCADSLARKPFLKDGVVEGLFWLSGRVLS